MNDSGFIGFPQNERHKVKAQGKPSAHDRIEAMNEAVRLLRERGHKATYEYPGFISVGGFAFGDAGGEEYGWNGEEGKEVIQPVTEESLPLTATAEDIAGWVFRVIREQKELGRVYSVLPPYTGSQTYPVAYRQAPGESGPGECFAIVAEFNGDGGAGDEGSRTARRFVQAVNEYAALQAVERAAEVAEKLSCNCPLMSLEATAEFERCKAATAYRVELAGVILEMRAALRTARLALAEVRKGGAK